MNLPQVARFCQYRGFLTASVKQRKGAGGSCSAAGARTGPLICTSARRPPKPAPDSGGSGDTSATHYRAPHPLKSGLKNISGPGLHKRSPLRNDPPPDRSSRALALRNGVAVLIRLAVPLCSADRFLTRLHQCPGHRETRAMGFLATSKARSARSLASASTPASRHPISTRSGCSCGSYESSWNAVAGRRSSLSKRSSPDPGGARRETVYSTLRGGAR